MASGARSWPTAATAAATSGSQWGGRRRSKSIGRRLLTYAIKTLGATRLDVNEQNEQALGFYQRMGFEVVGRSPLDGLGKPAAL